MHEGKRFLSLGSRRFSKAGLRGEGYLKKPDEEDNGAHGAHHAAVVVQESFPAATTPEVELLRLVVVAVVSRVVGDLVLDTGSRGAGVAAAEGDTVHQVPSVHVAFDPTMGRRKRTHTNAHIKLHEKAKQRQRGFPTVPPGRGISLHPLFI